MARTSEAEVVDIQKTVRSKTVELPEISKVADPSKSDLQDTTPRKKWSRWILLLVALLALAAGARCGRQIDTRDL